MSSRRETIVLYVPDREAGSWNNSWRARTPCSQFMGFVFFRTVSVFIQSVLNEVPSLTNSNGSVGQIIAIYIQSLIFCMKVEAWPIHPLVSRKIL